MDGQAAASSSNTSAASRRERPAPPASSGTQMPAKPSAAAWRSVSTGNTQPSSQAAAWGAISFVAKARAVARTASCSSDSSKSKRASLCRPSARRPRG